MYLKLNSKLLILLLFSALLTACSKDEQILQNEPPAIPLDTINCNDGAEISVDELTIQNNVWGKGNITNYQQCIRVTKNNSINTFEWMWSWPNSGNNVKAYPEIIYGLKPFGNTTTTSRLPVKLTEMNSINVSFDSIKTDMTGIGNLAFDIWITDSPSPVQNNIKHEIMIWLKNQGQAPAGVFIARIIIAGVEYDFYSGDVGSWDYFAFLKVTQDDLISIPVGDFINYLKNHSYILPEEYLSSIEFGNEVIQGSGKTSVFNYRVAIQ